MILAKNADAVVWCDNLAAKIYREDGVPAYAKQAAAHDIAAARQRGSVLPGFHYPDPRPCRRNVGAAGLQWTGHDSEFQRPLVERGLRQRQDSSAIGHAAWPDARPAARTRSGRCAESREHHVLRRCPGSSRHRGRPSRAAIRLKAGQRLLAEVPVSLRVHSFTLPRDPTLRTLITYSPAALKPWDKRPLDQIERDVCRVLHEHGIRGCGATAVVAARLVDGSVVCDFRGFDERLNLLTENLGCNAFFLGPMFGGGTSEGWVAHQKWLGMEPLSPEFNRLFPQYLRQVAAHLKEKGWFDRAYLYLWDEPEMDYFDKVVALQKLALEADPGFKIWETTSPNYEAFWGVVKAWSIPFSRPFFDEDSVNARRRAGDEIWVYNIPASLEGTYAGPPPLVLAGRPLRHKGAQLWNVTWYHGINPWEDITPKPYPTGRGEKELLSLSGRLRSDVVSQSEGSRLAAFMSASETLAEGYRRLRISYDSSG